MTEPENQAEALDEKALKAAVTAFNTFGSNMSTTPPIASAIRSYLASLPEAPAVPVVKALEWLALSDQAISHTPFGVYRIMRSRYSTSTGKFDMIIAGGEMPKSFHDSEDEAKAAAQADFEARIRSALQSSPPVKAAAVDGEIDRLPRGHTILEQADMPDGRVSQTVRRSNGTEYERIVDPEEAYGEDE